MLQESSTLLKHIPFGHLGGMFFTLTLGDSHSSHQHFFTEKQHGHVCLVSYSGEALLLFFLERVLINSH